MIVAAAPAWFADNVTIIALVVLVLVTFLVLRLVKEAVTKSVLLALIAAVAVLVYVNRDARDVCQGLRVRGCRTGPDRAVLRSRPRLSRRGSPGTPRA